MALLAMLAVAASGCSGADEGAGEEDPGAGTGTRAPSPQALPGEGSPALVLTGCVGLRAFTDYAQGTAPGSAPAGWAPSRGPVVTVGVLGLDCQRVAVGPFERGPVHLVLDWHDGALAPAACMAGARDDTVPLVLGSVLADDPEVAAFLAQAHGMPARGAAVVAGVAGEVPAGAAGVHDWRWTADGADAAGGGESRLAVAADPAVGPETTDVRMFWPVGDGIASLDLELEGTGPIADRPAVGSMAPPMLAGEFAGLGHWFPSLEASARFGGPMPSDCSGGAP